jgi:hypothetical protein
MFMSLLAVLLENNACWHIPVVPVTFDHLHSERPTS